MWSFFSIVFLLNSKISLQCKHFNDHFLCVFFRDCKKWFDMHILGSKSYYLHNWNFNWTESSSKLLLTIPKTIVIYGFMCVACVHAYCADDLESDYYQSLWHFRQITSPQVFSAVCFHSIEFHIFLCKVSFCENKIRENNFVLKQTAMFN